MWRSLKGLFTSCLIEGIQPLRLLLQQGKEANVLRTQRIDKWGIERILRALETLGAQKTE